MSLTPLDTSEALGMIDWYRRCLEDVQDGRPVRNLDEAKLGYDRALESLRESAKAESSWTCPHGTTYSGSEDFISGARNAHSEEEGRIAAFRDEGHRSVNDIAQDIIISAPAVEPLVEEWFAAITDRSNRLWMLEAERES